MFSAVVGACEKTIPAFRPECERKLKGAVGQHREGVKNGRSPILPTVWPIRLVHGSRFAGDVCPRAAQPTPVATRTPFWSNSVAAVCSSWPSLRTSSSATSGVLSLIM